MFSAAKLFFAYGLGNALTFPLSVGATTRADGRAADARGGRSSVLRRHTADALLRRADALRAHAGRSELPPRATSCALRLCVSAGEALPREIGERWTRAFGVDILDGIGSTEMLHIFLSNRPGDVRYGTTGKPVPGYDVRLVDDDGARCRRGEIGDL